VTASGRALCLLLRQFSTAFQKRFERLHQLPERSACAAFASAPTRVREVKETIEATHAEPARAPRSVQARFRNMG
jgi:hypothetical protein